MQLEGQAKRLGYRLVGDVVVTAAWYLETGDQHKREQRSGGLVQVGTHVGPIPPLLDAIARVSQVHVSPGSASKHRPRHHEIVALAHAAGGLDNLALVIFNHLDAFKVLLQTLAVDCISVCHPDWPTYNSLRKAPFGHVGRVGLAHVNTTGES